MIFRSMMARAALALAFLIGYYALILSVGLLLFAVPVLITMATNTVVVKLYALCWILAGALLWTLVPRRVKFEAPGPLLDEASEPRLFAFVREVAQRMGQPMPKEIYAVPHVNAFVAQRGGFLGQGGTRFMGIGLGLMAVDNVSQFKATIAHEFGHFAGGDTKLLGLTMATRSAMIRAVGSVSSGALQKLFEIPLKAYLRITQAISRQQELIADEWSMRLAGRRAHITGLHAEALHGAGFNVFVATEVDPVLRMNKVPANVFEGYRRFVRSTTWNKLQPQIQERMKSPDKDPYDSHPPLDERVAYAEALSGVDEGAAMDERPATVLLSDPAALEQRLSAFYAPEGATPLSWEEMAQSYADTWRRSAVRAQVRIPGLTAGGAIESLRDLAERRAFAERVVPVLTNYRLPDQEQVINDAARNLAQCYLGVLLAGTGLTWRTDPGEALLLEGRGEVVNLNELTLRIVGGEGSVVELSALLDRHGLAEGAQLACTPEEAAPAREPNAIIGVATEGKKLRVTAPFQPLLFPRSCCFCHGDAEEVIQVAFKIGGFINSDQTATVPLAVCQTDRGRASTILDVRSYDQASDTITFDVEDPQFVELIKAVNA